LPASLAKPISAEAMTALGAPARRWNALDRGGRIAFAGISLLLAAGIVLRVWFMLGYRPAFLGFPDSHEYVSAATLNIFRDAQHPAGYPLFLRLVHHLSDRLSFTILVQHVLGLASGFLLYRSVCLTGAPRWLGLVPAAVVLFAGTGLFLEQSLLADSLFAFLQALGVYAAMRSLNAPSSRWPLLAGLAIGLSFWVRTVALSSAVLVPLLLLLDGDRRRRRLSAASAAGAVIAMVLVYVLAQAAFTGYWGYERQSSWDLYARVATFVDCSHFTPPRGTRFLCPSQPVGQRLPQNYYQYAPSAPAVVRFGGPSRAPAGANSLLQKFDIAAIEHEPIAYAKAVVRGLGFYVFPREGEGYTPSSLDSELLNPAGERAIEPAITAFYAHSSGYRSHAGAVGALTAYERDTRIEGPLLILLLACAIVGTPLLSGRVRSGAALFTLTALLSIALAVATNSYDARYAYPTFGPLAAGAALGAWGIASLLSARVRGRRARRK
jgi:Dolichyl-phosphate-mannose-protein mannosyltransferase